MSYDFEIWSVRRFQPDFLSKAQQGALSGRGWQIVINPSDKILPEDADEEVSAWQFARIQPLNAASRPFKP